MMICTVLGIAPPLEDAHKTELRNGIVTNHGVRWDRDTLEESWIAPDEDNDGAPTMLLSAFLPGDDEDDVDNKRISPEALASLVQEQLDRVDTEKRYRCEVWASAPAPLPFVRISSNSDNELGPETFRRTGLCVLPRVLSKEDEVVSRIRSQVDDHIVQAETAIANNHPHIRIGDDSFLFREIASRSKQRFDLLVPKETNLYDLVSEQVFGTTANRDIPGLLQDIFRDPTTEEPLLDWAMDLSVVYSKPGANHQGWHADGGHIDNNDVFEDTARQANRPYAVCLFVPLIDLDHKVGFTQFWPGSHQSRTLVGFGPFAEVSRTTWDGIVPAGDGILYDYRLLHRGMPNRTPLLEDAPPYRPVLQLLFRRSWYKEKNNYGLDDDTIYQSSSQR